MRLGTAPPLRARLLAPQIYRREPDPKARGDHRRRQTGRISQQHPLAQISRIGAWHHCLLQETNHSTHKQYAFQIHTESALIAPKIPGTKQEADAQKHAIQASHGLATEAQLPYVGARGFYIEMP